MSKVWIIYNSNKIQWMVRSNAYFLIEILLIILENYKFWWEFWKSDRNKNFLINRFSSENWKKIWTLFFYKFMSSKLELYVLSVKSISKVSYFEILSLSLIIDLYFWYFWSLFSISNNTKSANTLNLICIFTALSIVHFKDESRVSLTTDLGIE
jgi:hypothetical protein